ncbi:MAG: hypothetical protein V2I54_01245 [Bacteroidales bacterium]|jgi:hypothetical protein|nr:hypothetical protein [Bacteroidales bacterium]
MKKFLNTLRITLFLCLLGTEAMIAQNVAVTDDEGYGADPSAMLDVKSTDKGILIPRLTSIQREAINSPATGLMVYDINFNSFFYYDGSNWLTLPQLSTSVAADEALFAVVNTTGDTVFAVYNDGVKVSVPAETKGRLGGFAVSGRTSTKEGDIEYLRVTPDSTRIYVNDKAVKGRLGGFAVSVRTSTKGIVNDYLIINDDSTRIYVKDSTSTKGRLGGFAVSGRTSTKGSEAPFLNVDRYNYFIGHESGYKNTSGSLNSFFGYQTGYENNGGRNNVFLGYQAGFNNTSGSFNNFIGYQAGYSNREGGYNEIIGYKAALSDTSPNFNLIMGYETAANADHNFQSVILGSMAARESGTNSSSILIGSQAGYSNRFNEHSIMLGVDAGHGCDSSYYDIFIGDMAGASIDNSILNIFIGPNAGNNLTQGNYNVLLGGHTANHYEGTRGSFNTIMGYQAGYMTNGDGNVFLGYNAGYNEKGSNKLYISNSGTSTPLIKGDFSTGKTTFNHIVNLTGVNEFPDTPAEGDMVRIKEHPSESDGVYIFNGNSWVSLVTW